MITELVKWGFAFTFSSPSFLGRKVKWGPPHNGFWEHTQGSTDLRGLDWLRLLFRPTCNSQWPQGMGDWGTGDTVCHPHLSLADTREWGLCGPSGHRRV